MPVYQTEVEKPVLQATWQSKVATYSSGLIRALSYVFLQWVPAPPLPNIIFTLLPIYVTALISGYFHEPRYELMNEIKATPAEDKHVTADGTAVEPHSSVVVEQAFAAREKSVSLWKTLLTGAPNPRSLLCTTLPLLLNVASVGMVADRLYREHLYTAEDLSFVRVGYISDRDASLLIREPDQSKMPVTIDIRLKDPQPPFENPTWQSAGGVAFTTNETDYTVVLRVPLRHTKLRLYEWKSSNNHSGEFLSAPKVGSLADVPDGQFTFLSSSCIVSRLPYNPLDHPLSIPGMRHLANVLPSLKAQFMLFLGDFIYVDVPRFWGKTVADYRQKYRQVYASPDWASVGQNLSWIHVLDDHEISNDWHAGTAGVYEAAADPWRHYHVAANPPPANVAGNLTTPSQATYFEFSQGPASFFLMDTRTYRSSNLHPADSVNKTMLGAEQLQDLLAFLRKPEPKGVKWKIIASSVPFTKNWQVNTKDTWGGFLVERRTILEVMWDVGAQGMGVVILSGDRHEFAATKFPPPADSKWPSTVAAHEFSASPLSQFYAPISTYRQIDNEDVAVKYIRKGNSKFGAITIEGHEQGEQSTLKYRLFVDGKEVWDTVVVSPPAVLDSKPIVGSFWDRIKDNYVGR